MNDIKITDDFSEAVEIGKVIYNEKQEIYNKGLVKSIYKTIDLNMHNASAERKEDLFYHSIYDYWVYGALINEEFYFNFYKIADKDKRKFATSKERTIYLKQLNPISERYILSNKYETYKKFEQYYKRDVILICDESDYEKFSQFAYKHKEFVVKPLDLGLGIGVHKESVDNPEDMSKVFKKLLNEGLTCVDQTNKIHKTSIILEEVIKQADSIGCLHPESINGVRVTTLRCGDEIHILHPWIKMGVNGAFVTSAVLGSIDAAIDAKTGIVDTIGIGEFGQREEKHPNTGIEIKGFQIPRWNELINIAKEAARALPNLRYVGWDFALTDGGWVMMEGNSTGDFLWQLLYEKGMKQEFEEISGIKLNKKFWWE